MNIDNACEWLKTNDPSYTGDRLLHRAGKRAALLAANEYDGDIASRFELALVALDLCPLARDVGLGPGTPRLIGCEQTLGLTHVTSWICELTLQLPSRRSEEAPAVLARIFTVLERRCTDAGTTMAEALESLMASITERTVVSMDAAAATDAPDYDAVHAA